jgi:hypothetical protein
MFTWCQASVVSIVTTMMVIFPRNIPSTLHVFAFQSVKTTRTIWSSSIIGSREYHRLSSKRWSPKGIVHSGTCERTHFRRPYFPLHTKSTNLLERFQGLSSAEYSSLTNDGTYYTRPVVQWYPGHIAKAERQLAETLKAVDVVVEVRDARICKATAHPRVGEWCAGRPRIVVLTHLDTVPRAAVNSWKRAYETLGAERWDDAPINRQVANQAQQAQNIRNQYVDPEGRNKKIRNNEKLNHNPSTYKKIEPIGTITPVEEVLFVDAKQGQGIHALHRAIFKAGEHVQERRERRGLNPRALRVGIIGYPNVGKVRQSM